MTEQEMAAAAVMEEWLSHPVHCGHIWSAFLWERGAGNREQQPVSRGVKSVLFGKCHMEYLLTARRYLALST